MPLAENQLAFSALKLWSRRIGFVAVVIGVLVGVLYSLANMGKHPVRKAAMAKITLVDKAPPPPPKPEKDIPKPQPKDVRLNQPKQVEAPPQAPPSLKMEGEGAANGIAGVEAGSPTSEYKGGPLGDGQGVGGLGRAEFALYLNRLQRQIQETLVKDPRFKGVNYRLPASVLLRDDGSLRSIQLVGTTGSAELDDLMKSELLRIIRKDPPPTGSPTGGFTVRVTNRML
jgi:periplasmic protein TonB